MDRSPAMMPNGGGTSAGGGVGGNTTRNNNANNGISTSSTSSSIVNSPSPSSVSSNTPSNNHVTTSKPSLSQQILRTFRPRASVTAAPFMSSATASPMTRATIPNDAIFASSEASSSQTKLTTTNQEVAIKTVANLTLNDYQKLLKDLRKSIRQTSSINTGEEQVEEQRDAAFQTALSSIQTLLAALKTIIDVEEAADANEDTDWNTHQMNQPGPPQAEVFRTCLLILTQGKAGLLPLPFCLSVCELVTASVHLSDLRANRTTKAARETRSGAPGSQSSKALDADPPLANIDRAALYTLICHLSDHTRGSDFPSKENQFETRLPALPMQLKALEVLTFEGKEVVSFPGLLEFLGDGLITTWQELQVLRRLSSREIVEGIAKDITPEQQEEQTIILEQLTLREWTVLSCLHLITSIMKFSFSKLGLDTVENVLMNLTNMMHSSTPIQTFSQSTSSRGNQSEQQSRRTRSKSKERRPLTEGYDYYGLDTLNHSDNSTPSATPRGVMTPKVLPTSTLANATTMPVVPQASVAPIALATVPPVSSIRAAATVAVTTDPNTAARLAQPILQETDVRAVLKLIDSTLRFGFMPPRSVDGVTRLLCCILGYHLVEPNGETDWSSLSKDVLANLLRSHCANASIRCARNILIDETDEFAIILCCGAVEFLRGALLLVAESEANKSTNSIQNQTSTSKSGVSSEDALAPYISIPLLIPALSGALRRHVDVLDIQVLNMVSEMLPLKDGRHILGSRLTPDDWDLLLELPGIAKRHLMDFHNKFGRRAPTSTHLINQEKAATPAVIEAMLNLVSRLKMADLKSNTEEGGKGNENELPWTPKLATLLLSLAPFLSDKIIVDLVEYYKARHLCLPCTTEWIVNVRSLLNALFHRDELVKSIKMNDNNNNFTQTGNVARTTLVKFLFEHVYETVQDLPKHRSALLLSVILPLAQSALAAESDLFVETTMRRALIDAAVTAISSTGASASIAQEEVEGNGDQEDDSDGDRIFNEIVELHEKMARSSTISNQTFKDTTTTNTNGQHVSFKDPPGSHEHKPGSRTHSRNNSLTNNTVESSSTTISTKSLPKSKSIQSAIDLITIFHRLAFSSPWVLLPTFSRSREQDETVQRLAWERRARSACLMIYRKMLEMIQPVEISSSISGEPAATSPNPPSSVPTPVRLAILQWLVRIRTDGEHRVYVVGDVHDLIAPAANTLRRGTVTGSSGVNGDNEISTTEPSIGDRNRSTTRRDTLGAVGHDGGRESNRNRSAAERSASRIRDASRERERGRREGYGDENAAFRLRSPSRSRIPISGVANSTASGSSSTAANTIRRNVEPLWRIPETIMFDAPQAGWRSDVVSTYMHPDLENAPHQHPHHHHHHRSIETDSTPPVPMPISDYIATCIAILTLDKEWDMVSYLLCHLPHQLANKHLVCGPKAQKQVLALRQILTMRILDQKFINQVILPEEVKKSDAYAVAYGTLTTLISYRALFSRSQQDEMVEAFTAGLNKSSNTAQPCIRALTVACYELQKSINRHLPKMLVKLSTVMSSSTMSVHILEMIAAIGNLPSLYANFTETDYRRIFGIALQYIQYHNQRSPEEDARSSATAFTLSQYVIMLAYYNISLWFLIIKLPDRIKYVESIRKGLLLANEGRSKIADQTEVCFDFLARYTHSNAEPRPQESFLNQLVKAKGGQGLRNTGSGPTTTTSSNPTTKHFLYGKGLLSISTLDKNGWSEILIRRPSGTIGLLCKLENVPISKLPDEDEEKVDLPGSMMMNRSFESKEIQPSHHKSLAVWVKQQLQEYETKSDDRPLGPLHHLSLSIKPRSASFSFEGNKAQGAITFVKHEVDAYTKALEEDLSYESSGDLLLPESDELRATMQRVLADTSSDGQGLQITERSGAGNGNEGQGTTTNPTTTTTNTNDPPTTGAMTLKTKSTYPRNEHTFDPGFLAIQLSAYPDVQPWNKPPILLPNEAWVDRMVRAVDLTPTVDFHRIGVLYVGAGQTQEKPILGNRNGSNRYAQFLRGLGDLITLKGQKSVYTGGLDTHNDEHGKYAYVWGDDISQIVYHTTTLMPNDPANDPMHSRKKALIGNDWVRIIWNESGQEYDPQTIRTQFNYVSIVISPNSRGGVELGSVSAADTLFYRVSLQCIEGLPDFAPIGDGQLISAAVLPNFIRLLALNCSLVSQIFVATGDRQSGQQFNYTSNWVSRLQHLERARTKIENEIASKTGGSSNATTGQNGNSGGTEQRMGNNTSNSNIQNGEEGNGGTSGDNDLIGKDGLLIVSASDPAAYNILRF